MTAVIDRIEENKIICELSEKISIELPLSAFPWACEGQCIDIFLSDEKGCPAKKCENGFIVTFDDNSTALLPPEIFPGQNTVSRVCFAKNEKAEAVRRREIQSLMDQLFTD